MGTLNLCQIILNCHIDLGIYLFAFFFHSSENFPVFVWQAIFKWNLGVFMLWVSRSYVNLPFQLAFSDLTSAGKRVISSLLQVGLKVKVCHTASVDTTENVCYYCWVRRGAELSTEPPLVSPCWRNWNFLLLFHWWFLLISCRRRLVTT